MRSWRDQAGDLQGLAIWLGFILAVVMVPVALILAAVGGWRAMKRPPP